MGAATWVVGAAINVVGSILINLGTVCLPSHALHCPWGLPVLYPFSCTPYLGRLALDAECVQNVMKLGHNKRLAKPVNERPLVRSVAGSVASLQTSTDPCTSLQQQPCQRQQ